MPVEDAAVTHPLLGFGKPRDGAADQPFGGLALTRVANPRYRWTCYNKGTVDADTLLAQLIALETEVDYRQPPTDGRPPFRYERGRLPILLSAPHGAAHRRNGRYKQEDEYTSAIARLVAAETGAHVLYSYALSDSDPNWDVDSPYKDCLRSLVADCDIGFVLDIHGMSNRHRIGIAVGTIGGVSCPDYEAIILDSLKEESFVETTAAQARQFERLRWDHFVLNHHRFTGGLVSHTITRYASQELGIAAAQIELCGSLRIVRPHPPSPKRLDFRGDPAGIVRTVKTLRAIVDNLSDML